MTSDAKHAGTKPIEPVSFTTGLSPGIRTSNRPRRRYAYSYAVTRAIPLVAKLMTPDARYVTTNAKANDANTAPLARPRSRKTRCGVTATDRLPRVPDHPIFRRADVSTLV